jgi:hypothetical protein
MYKQMIKVFSQFSLRIREYTFDQYLQLNTHFSYHRKYLIEISQKTESEIFWSYFLTQEILKYHFNAHDNTRQQEILLVMNLWLSHSEIPSSTKKLAQHYILKELKIPISETEIVKFSQPLSLDYFPKCYRCLYFHGRFYNDQILICAIHPFGRFNNCPDFEVDSAFEKKAI